MRIPGRAKKGMALHSNGITYNHDRMRAWQTDPFTYTGNVLRPKEWRKLHGGAVRILLPPLDVMKKKGIFTKDGQNALRETRKKLNEVNGIPHMVHIEGRYDEHKHDPRRLFTLNSQVDKRRTGVDERSMMRRKVAVGAVAGAWAFSHFFLGGSSTPDVVQQTPTIAELPSGVTVQGANETDHTSHGKFIAAAGSITCSGSTIVTIAPEDHGSPFAAMERQIPSDFAYDALTPSSRATDFLQALRSWGEQPVNADMTVGSQFDAPTGCVDNG